MNSNKYDASAQWQGGAQWKMSKSKRLLRRIIESNGHLTIKLTEADNSNTILVVPLGKGSEFHSRIWSEIKNRSVNTIYFQVKPYSYEIKWNKVKHGMDGREYIRQKNRVYEPTEVNEPTRYLEGATRTSTVNAYERNANARAACIAHHGTRCAVCDMSFAERYGEQFAGLIHVHHLIPLTERGGEYEIDPKNDLVPVCPNCHFVIHQRNPVYTIKEIATMLSD